MIINGQYIDGRKHGLRKLTCPHNWQNIRIGPRVALDKCLLCGRKKKRKVASSIRKYRARPAGTGVNVCGVFYYRNKYVSLPVVYHGMNTAPRG